MTRYSMGTLVPVGMALFCSSLLAADIHFQGALVEPPPCTINNNKDLLVSFGNSIGVNKVDGSNYIQPVDYHLTCDNTSPQAGLNLVLITTNPDSSDPAAVQSDIAGFGIRLLVDGSPASFGQLIPVDVASPPVLQAVPVKAPSATLAEGPFSATATLQVVYQ
ncbi:fimbrial protein [Serratia ureilytica]|uniref:fimbrial protein n=1 Tax=Serratia ureilytica TaxID=300181 RepID=UPI0034C61E5C